ncbi:MFS transporter [Streptomyces kaempferi]
MAFASIAAVFILFMAASSAPSPLYVIYQQEWSFSATTLTSVFAVYVAGMIAALLVLGALSDHIGRRPVLATAIALEAVAMVLFIVAATSRYF